MINHLACIMDGNRRWAKKQKLYPWQGHEKGVETINVVTDFCIQNKIQHLSLFAFSIQNLNRSQREINTIFNLIAKQIVPINNPFHKKNIRVRFIGDRALFPKQIKEQCLQLEAETQHHSALSLNILFCYGAREEIATAVKNIIKKVKAGALHEDAICPETIMQELWLGDTPDPDLIIRTGNRKRLSNFLLYQAAYSELYFSDRLWPEITIHDLEKAVTYFQHCKRNFGK